jgi:hypothetical protein
MPIDHAGDGVVARAPAGEWKYDHEVADDSLHERWLMRLTLAADVDGDRDGRTTSTSTIVRKGHQGDVNGALD